MSRFLAPLALLAAVLALLPLAASGQPVSRSADVPMAFKQIDIWLAQGWQPESRLIKGSPQYYQLVLSDSRRSGLSQLMLDVSLPQQSVNVSAIQVYSTGSKLLKTEHHYSGNHLHWVFRHISGGGSLELHINSVVSQKAKGSICNTIYLRLPSGQLGNYSPPCVKLR